MRPPPLGGLPSPDLLLAAGVAVATLVGLVDRRVAVAQPEEGGGPFTRPDVLALVLVLVIALPIAMRTRRLWSSAVVTCAGSLAFWALGYAPQPIPYGPLVIVFTLAERESTRKSLIATSSLLLAILGESFYGRSVLSDDLLVAYLLSSGASWSLGYGVKVNRERTALLEAQAVQLAREQSATTDLAIERERARIARELHDIVSHHVSVIVAQAVATRLRVVAEPQACVQTLQVIETTGREAMVQMRRMLGVLQPRPELVELGREGLDRLPDLLAATGGAGRPVELEVQGIARPLPPDVDVAAYLILREALTNSLRHAGDARAHVLLAYQDDAVRLRVHDDGTAVPEGSSGGHGLAGILQRVTLLGGSFAAGPVRGGGFEVVVELPTIERPT